MHKRCTNQDNFFSTFLTLFLTLPDKGRYDFRRGVKEIDFKRDRFGKIPRQELKIIRTNDSLSETMTNKKGRLLKYRILPLLIIASLFWGCKTTETRGDKTGQVHHLVICWLKEPGDNEARGKLIDASIGFKKIPGVLSVSAGPVLPSKRAIVDSSFDVAIVITFENRQAMDDYREHPVHKKALNEVLRPLVDRIIVYDFIE